MDIRGAFPWIPIAAAPHEDLTCLPVRDDISTITPFEMNMTTLPNNREVWNACLSMTLIRAPHDKAV